MPTDTTADPGSSVNGSGFGRHPLWAFVGRYEIQWHLLMAASLVAIVPVFVGFVTVAERLAAANQRASSDLPERGGPVSTAVRNGQVAGTVSASAARALAAPTTIRAGWFTLRASGSVESSSSSA